MTLSAAHLKLAHSDTTQQIIGAFYDVYNALGYGFVESVYANSLPIAMTKRGLHCRREVPLSVLYDGQEVGNFRADAIVNDLIVVEIKAVERIAAAHEAQIMNYLCAARLSIGLIMNFGPTAQFRRIIWAPTNRQSREQTTTDKQRI